MRATGHIAWKCISLYFFAIAKRKKSESVKKENKKKSDCIFEQVKDVWPLKTWIHPPHLYIQSPIFSIYIIPAFLLNFYYSKKINQCAEIFAYIYYRTRANKGRGFYSKIVFSILHNGVFQQFFLYSWYARLHEKSIKRTYFW